jgi:hypothetical protein
MSDAVAALRAGAAALLAAEGAPALATLVAGATLEVLPPERWTIGTRPVAAHRLSLAVDAADFVMLRADAAALSAVRAAFDAAVRAPDSELAELSLVLRLPAVARRWGHVYRDAPPEPPQSRPTPAEVLAGARELLEAQGHGEAAALLDSATLDAAQVGSSAAEPLWRWVASFSPAALVAAQRALPVADAIRSAIYDAALRPSERIASVELGLRRRAR